MHARRHTVNRGKPSRPTYRKRPGKEKVGSAGSTARRIRPRRPRLTNSPPPILVADSWFGDSKLMAFPENWRNCGGQGTTLQTTQSTVIGSQQTKVTMRHSARCLQKGVYLSAHVSSYILNKHSLINSLAARGDIISAHPH